MKKLSLLGSTGSIGTQTLDIVRENPDKYKVVSLSANRNIDLLEKQIREFSPNLVCVYDDYYAEQLKVKVSDLDVKICSGMQGLIDVATHKDADTVLTAVVGMIGVLPTIEAIKSKKNIALANKETLVTAGHIIMDLVKENRVSLLPVDSEHSAIFQSLQGIVYENGLSVANGNKQVSKILLTASGGPFRGLTREQMKDKTRFDALKHPNWSMGAKITIDSSTLVNKGLEMMEAGWLFGVSRSEIEVVVHPQSIIHSAVEFIDGAVIAQLGVPDMKLPIQYALTYPERLPMGGKKLDLFELQKLEFFKPDLDAFKALKLAGDCMDKGGNMPTIFNAANEWLVAKFLKDEIGFLDISDWIEKSVDELAFIDNPSVEQILETQKATEDYLASKLS